MHASCIKKALICGNVGDGNILKAAMTLKIPTLGFCFTEHHREALFEHLTLQLLEEMPEYKELCANGSSTASSSMDAGLAGAPLDKAQGEIGGSSGGGNPGEPVIVDSDSASESGKSG